MNKHKFALSFSLFVALVHVVWSALVGMGLATGLVNFVHNLHFIKPMVTIEPFTLGRAASLVVMSFIVSYCAAYVFAAIWQAVHKK